VAATPAPAAGGVKPNFSGTWNLDVSKSDFGVFPPPNKRTTSSNIMNPRSSPTSEDGAQGQQDYTLNLTTDGKESTNNAGGLELKSILNWEGSSLITNIKLKFQDNDVTVKDVWLLSDDGKTLTHNAHFVSPMGEMDTKLVFAKATRNRRGEEIPLLTRGLQSLANGHRSSTVWGTFSKCDRARSGFPRQPGPRAIPGPLRTG